MHDGSVGGWVNGGTQQQWRVRFVSYKNEIILVWGLTHNEQK